VKRVHSSAGEAERAETVKQMAEVQREMNAKADQLATLREALHHEEVRILDMYMYV